MLSSARTVTIWVSRRIYAAGPGRRRWVRPCRASRAGGAESGPCRCSGGSSRSTPRASSRPPRCCSDRSPSPRPCCPARHWSSSADSPPCWPGTPSSCGSASPRCSGWTGRWPQPTCSARGPHRRRRTGRGRRAHHDVQHHARPAPVRTRRRRRPRPARPGARAPPHRPGTPRRGRPDPHRGPPPAQTRRRPSPEDLRADVGLAQEATRSGLDEIRRIARRLRPGVLEELGLASALRSLAADFSHHGLTVRHDVPGDLPPLTPRRNS